MVRTQIYLTEVEQLALRRLAQQTGRTQSELIREAVDRFIAISQKTDRHSLLKQGRGLWSNRVDLPDFTKLRCEFDRSLGESS